MPIYKQPSKKKFPIRFFFFFDILVIMIIGRWMLHKTITLDTSVMIEKGDTFSSFIQPLDWIDTWGVKLYAKLYNADISKIQLGNYQFSGSYTKQEFFQIIQQGPSENFVRYTILEGRSIYDIDYDLARKGYIQPGAYIAYVTDVQQIARVQDAFPVIQKIVSNSAVSLVSLEGFLYPDTYFIDKNKDFLQQLIQLQLTAFSQKMQSLGSVVDGALPSSYDVNISPYEMLTLASVVEKEEKNVDNKPTVAGVFLYRLEKGMRLDADITLCYGLKQPYETCTPSLIAKEIYDTKNPFNTRQQAGIPSQPIANPSIESIRAVVEHVKTNYIYYLHAMDGQIYYGATLQEHNENKRLYLK